MNGRGHGSNVLEFQLPNPLNKPRKKGEEEERERHAKSEEGLEKEGGKCVRAVAVTRERSGVGFWGGFSRAARALGNSTHVGSTHGSTGRFDFGYTHTNANARVRATRRFWFFIIKKIKRVFGFRPGMCGLGSAT